MAWDWGGIVKEIAPAVVGLGGQLIMNNQNVQNAQGQANAQLQALQTQYQIALANQQTVALQNQMNKPQVTDSGGSKVALYVGLGLGGVLILGLAIYAVRK